MTRRLPSRHLNTVPPQRLAAVNASCRLPFLAFLSAALLMAAGFGFLAYAAAVCGHALPAAIFAAQAAVSALCLALIARTA